MSHEKHMDGADVVIIDDRDHNVPAVEVRLEPGIAVVFIDQTARAWVRELLKRAPDDTLTGAVHSARGGQLHHCGAMRVVCV